VKKKKNRRKEEDVKEKRRQRIGKRRRRTTQDCSQVIERYILHLQLLTFIMYKYAYFNLSIDKIFLILPLLPECLIIKLFICYKLLINYDKFIHFFRACGYLSGSAVKVFAVCSKSYGFKSTSFFVNLRILLSLLKTIKHENLGILRNLLEW
jgi:hypothetical protein